MARKHKHEDHQNHEAWAIPYGDLITLLLAFFVVMYAVSSINEGKYRVLSESLSEAFGGPPKSIKPLQFGTKQQRGSESDSHMSMLQQQTIEQSIGGITRDLRNPSIAPARIEGVESPGARAGTTGFEKSRAELTRMAQAVEKALGDLIAKDLIVVRRTDLWLEVEIRTDILFPSGVARISPAAVPVLERLAGIMKDFENKVRIEGHTDNVPIATAAFPSNWELSAARAASVVHLFMERGVDPARMTVVGMGEFHPVGDNASADGRNRNRRVVLVVMGTDPDPRETRDAAGLPDAVMPVASATAAPSPASGATPATEPASEPQVVDVPAGTLEQLHADGRHP